MLKITNKPKRPKIGKRELTWIIVGVSVVAAYVLLQNFGKVTAFFGRALEIAAPFILGVGIAYLLSLLMRWLERRLFGRMKSKKAARALSLTLTMLITLAALTGLFFAIIPQLVNSISSLVTSISGYFESSEETVTEWALRIGIPQSLVQAALSNWEGFVNTAISWASDRIPDIINAGVQIGSGIMNFIVALFVAVYLLADLERLMRQVKKVVLALLGERRYRALDRIRIHCHRAFGGFLVGKTIDSLIIGVLCFTVMMIFGWHYPLLISVVIGVTNIIPTFGPFIGAIPSILILLIIDPMQALWFTVFIIILQQIDGNLLGPAILGDKLGLSALWILFSVVFFGSIWGVPGMVVGVPLFSVIYDLSGGFIRRRLAEKHIDPDTAGSRDPPGTPDADEPPGG